MLGSFGVACWVAPDLSGGGPGSLDQSKDRSSCTLLQDISNLLWREALQQLHSMKCTTEVPRLMTCVLFEFSKGTKLVDHEGNHQRVERGSIMALGHARRRRLWYMSCSVRWHLSQV